MSGVEELVSWETAVATGRRLAPAGPKVSRAEAADLVGSLRSAAARAQDPVAHTARMAPGVDAPVLVVDRAGWLTANVASMSAMLRPVTERLTALRTAEPGAVTRAVGGHATGLEAGSVLAWMSTKVLGQLDLAPQASPRLLLVAPNILAAEREMDVDPHDFRLWVALHEETHRVQLTGVPWLRDHVIGQVDALTAAMIPEPDAVADRVGDLVRGVGDLVRGRTSPLEAVASPAQRESLARMTAVMSLLEGHADVVMDAAGPSVVPSVAHIRRVFEERRKGRSALDRLLRRLLGMEAKMAQYRDGAAFVRGVQSRVGVDGFNAVWTSPETLPLPREIHDPQAWVARVHG